MTKRDVLDLGKSIYWNDEVNIRIQGVSGKAWEKSVGRQICE